MPTAVESLDQLLIESEADSMDWCDGLGHEAASDLLNKLQESEWVELQSLCLLRGVNWRECLATAFSPKQSKAAERILFTLASDREGEVSFYALSKIDFCCGVNSKAEGAFVDASIQLPPFVEAARLVPELPAAIQRICASSSEQLRQRLELLVKVMQS